MARFTGLAVVVLSIVSGMLTPGPVWAGGDFGKIPDSVWSLTAPLDCKDANALILFDRCTLTVSLDGIEIIRHRRLKALNKAGVDAIGTASIAYNEEDKLKDFEAFTYSPAGAKTKVDKKSIGKQEVGGSKLQTFSFPAVDSGCVVEYRYRHLNTRFGVLDPWYFSNSKYTLLSHLTLILHPGFTYNTAVTNLSPLESTAKETEIPNPNNFLAPLKAFTWEKKSIRPISDEPYTGAVANYLAAIHCQIVSYKSAYVDLTFVDSWTDLGKALQRQFDAYAKGGKPEEEAARVVGDATTSVEKAYKLYNYVAAGFKAKADQAGERMTNETQEGLLKSRSGTPEEKNFWLCQLCKAAGLQAWPVLIATRDTRRINPQICQLGQFDHLITFVQFDSGYVFMDATSQYCPYGMLPPKSRANLGFLIDGEKSEIIRINLPDIRSYRFDATCITIEENGLTRCSTVCQFTGLYGAQYGRYFDEGEPAKIVKEDFVDKLDEGATIDTFSYESDSTGNFRLMFVYDSPNLARSLDSLLIVKFTAFSFRDNPFTASRRQFPIDFDFPRTIHTLMQIRSAKPLTVVALPPTAKEEIDGAVFTCLGQLKDSVVTVESKIRLTKALYAPTEYQQVKTFFDAVARTQQEEVKLLW